MAFLGLSRGHDWWAHPDYEKVKKVMPCLLSVRRGPCCKTMLKARALLSRPAMNHDAPRIVSTCMTALHVVVGDLCMGRLENGEDLRGTFLLSGDACLNLLSALHLKSVGSPEQFLVRSPKTCSCAVPEQTASLDMDPALGPPTSLPKPTTTQDLLVHMPRKPTWLQRLGERRSLVSIVI